ncbi:MAG: hypothetical protein EXS17_06445 [Phycisphaerales bacterium]|nr:hypothetical protein [Phycisphaerales bacterium]
MASCPSNREEIIELAQLEVLGALENADGVRLERLFREALPALQREVVDLQASMAVESLLLPVIEPERSLRLRVLASVAQAVEATDAELAPIASIGRPVSASRSLTSPFDRDSSATAQTNEPLPSLIDGRWRKSARYWRAACIASIAGLAAVMVFQVATARQAARIGELALQNSYSDELRDLLGKDLPEILEEGRIIRGLVGATARDNGSFTVALAPTFDEVLILWVDPALRQTFSLQSVDRQSGVVQTVGNFVAEHRLGGTGFKIPVGIANANSDWRVLDQRGSMLFTSRPTY